MRQLIVAFAIGAALPAGADTGADIYAGGGDGTARLAGGQVTVTASRFPCANCHGADARGGTEGATDVPPITWSDLTAPVRIGGSYDVAGFARLLREGVRPDGSAILSLMPRYDLPDRQIEALAGFLRSVEALSTTGITGDAVYLPQPRDPDFAEGLAAAIGDFNRGGGAFGRLLALADDGLAAADPALYGSIGSAVAAAERDALIAKLAERGVTQVALGAEDPDLAYRLAGAGIAVTAGSPTLLAIAPPLPTLTGIDAYLSHGALEGADRKSIGEARRLVVALPDDDELRRHLATGRNGQFIDGYIVGVVVGRALTNGGRRITAREIASGCLSIASSLRMTTFATEQISPDD